MTEYCLSCLDYNRWKQEDFHGVQMPTVCRRTKTEGQIEMEENKHER